MKVKKRTKFIEKIKNLHGDPHFVAMGMAIGVFVGITPTIPFHTILALTLAFALKASKPAALLGTLVCNPFAMVFIYYACYKTGNLLFGGVLSADGSVNILLGIIKQDIGFYDKMLSFAGFAQTQLKVLGIMLIGGVVLGVPSGAVSYYITKQFVKGVRVAREKIREKRKIK